MRRSARALVIVLLLAAAANARADAATGSIFPQPASVIVGQPVVFSVNASPTAGLPTTFTIAFGDGATAPISPPGESIVHRYATAGPKLVVLTATSPGITSVLARIVVSVLGNVVRVPLGEILDTVVIGSPVLAGTDLTVVMHYRIASPMASTANNLSDLQAVVDLADARGHLIRRSDPFPLAIPSLTLTAIQTAVIPYAVPVDAAGSYELIVFIRAAQGGTVAVSRTMWIHVLGGPDPAPKFVNQIHLNGALVAGPPSPGAPGALNFGMTTALQWPTYALSVTGLFDPISHKSDPVFVLAAATPGPISAPDAQTAGPAGSSAGSTPKYADIFGRAQASLPAFLGGGETLRGVDATYDYATADYHAAYGYTQLPTEASGARFGGIVDFTRIWSAADVLHFTLTDNRDDPQTFIFSGNAHPLDGRTGMLELDRSFDQHLSGVFAVGISGSQDLISGDSVPGASGRADLRYAIGKNSYELEYHNAGDQFATGTGLGAQSDRAGGSLNLQFGLSPISQVGFSFSQDALHSIFSRGAMESAAFTLTPPTGASLTLNLQQDHQLSANSDAITRGVTFALARAAGSGSWDASGSITSLVDALQPFSDGTSRTLKLDYQFRAGANALGFGVAGSNVTGAAANTLLGETVDYGTSFGALGPVPNTRRFELHASFTNTNTRATSTGGRDQSWNALLSYHLTQQMALGVTWASQQHRDIASPLDTQASGLSLRLDLNI